MVAAHAEQDAANVLTSRVKMALYELRDAARKIDLYRDTLLPKARQSLRASETAFRAGTVAFLDVIDTVRILLDFELSYERALADRAQSLAKVEMLIGRELPRGGRSGEEEREGPPGPEFEVAGPQPAS